VPSALTDTRCLGVTEPAGAAVESRCRVNLGYMGTPGFMSTHLITVTYLNSDVSPDEVKVNLHEKCLQFRVRRKFCHKSEYF